MANSDLNHFPSRAVRALVLLHERHLIAAIATWREASERGLVLPPTQEAAYANLDTLLAHILEAASEDFLWICDKLEIARPPLPPLPSTNAGLDPFLSALFNAWRTVLASLDDDRLYGKEYSSPWGATFSVHAMLEHLVMHAIRHEFQLREWLSGSRID